MNDGRDIARLWYDLATGDKKYDVSKDPFLRFFAIWVLFNAIYHSASTEEGGDRAETKEYGRKNEDKHNELRKKSTEYEEAFNYIKKDGVQNDKQTTVKLYEIKDDTCKELLDCVYQILCNFFHGRKITSSERDRDLVLAGYCVIKYLIEDELWQ